MEIRFASNKKPISKRKTIKEILPFLFDTKSLFYYFLLLICGGFLFYLIHIITNNGVILWSGDYTSQYYPMFYHTYDIWTGVFQGKGFPLWDNTIFLGVNSISSNAYYGLFSPFNILIMLFPREFIPWGATIISIFKLACSGLFFRTYLRKLTKHEWSARIGGLAYAFSGWMCFNLWYGNYIDIHAFFPLVLLGIEKVLKDKKPWVLMAGICCLILANYVIALTFILCGFIYAMFRYFQNFKNYPTIKEKIKIIGIGFLGFFIGICLACAIGFPSFFAALTSPKLKDESYLSSIKEALISKDFSTFFKMIFDWREVNDQHLRKGGIRVFYPIIEFFFPSITCRSEPYTEIANWDFDDISSSLWCFTPMILFFVPAIYQSIKKVKISHFIAILFFVFSLFTPFMYFALMGFTNAYGRWLLFFISSFICYVTLYIDKMQELPVKPLHFGAIFAVLGVCASYFISMSLVKNPEAKIGTSTLIKRFESNGFDYSLIIFLVELVYVVAVYLLILFFYKKEVIKKIFSGIILLETAIIGAFMFYGQGTVTFSSNNNNNSPYLVNSLKGVINEISKKDSSFYRIKTTYQDGWSENNGLLENYAGTPTFFHSLYNFNVDKFTKYIGVRSGTKDVGGRYLSKMQDVDNILGVKYYILDNNYSMMTNIKKQIGFKDIDYEPNVPFFYKKIDSDNKDMEIYQNTSYIDFALTYSKVKKDSYMLGSSSWSGNGFNSLYNSATMIDSCVLRDVDTNEVIENSDKELSLTSFTPSSVFTDLIKNNISQNGVDLNYYQVPETWNDVCNNPQNHLQEIVSIPTNPETKDTKTKIYKGENQRHFIFITKKDGSLLSELPCSYYFTLPFANNKKYKVFFIDENNYIYKFDDHNDHSTDPKSHVRSFYTNRKVKSIVIRPVYPASLPLESSFGLKSEYLSSFENRYNEHFLNENKVFDVAIDINSYSFKTNFLSSRMVVTRLAFDEGWKLFEVDEKNNYKPLKTYLGQGGFVSFLGKPGERTYFLEYNTPYLSTGNLLTCSGIMVFGLTFLGSFYFESKKRSLNQLNFFSNENLGFLTLLTKYENFY